MDTFKALWARLQSKFNLSVFMAREATLAKLLGERPLRILFSEHPGWEERIRGGFRHTHHQVSFAALETQNLQDFDLVVPLSVEAVLQLGTKGNLPSLGLLPMPSANCVHLCDDKRLLNERLIELGLGRYVPPMLDNPTVPFVLKKRIAANSDDCYLVRTPEERERLSDYIGHPDYFCQELVQGRSEYASHVLIKGGRIVTEVTVEYIASRGAYIKASEPFLADNIVRSPCFDSMEQVLAAIGYEGLCCLNYKMVDGRMRLIEINPRFGGSLAPLFFSMVRHLHPVQSVTMPRPVSVG